MLLLVRVSHICLAWIALTPLAAFAAGDSLPLGPHKPAIPLEHFPDRLHAFVFRNWSVVSPELMAKTVGGTAEQIKAIGASMGLPANPHIAPEFHRRGYITILRRNWHLLPYEQMLTILDMNADELVFRLREDDFLWLKLGSTKPKCDPLRYQQPSPAARARAAEIKQIVESTFGSELQKPEEPRFQFIQSLMHVDPNDKVDRASREDRGPRFIYSYFAVYGDPLLDPAHDPYPDGLLQKLSRLGVNGVWLHVILRQLAPGGKHFPEFGQDHEKRLENLRHLVDRASRYGIKVYLYMNEPRGMPREFFKNRREMAGVVEDNFQAICTTNPEVRKWISDSLEYVFRNAPKLGGVFTITASENLTTCASHGNPKGCLRCSKRAPEEIIDEINHTIADGVHRASPSARVLVWDWQWDGMGYNQAQIVAGLPKSAWLMSVSEWSLPISRGGVKINVGEYSISAVGPGPRATRQWELAKQRGLKTVAKVQLNNTWELSAIPYLPVPDLVARHCSNLAKLGTDGMMLSWSLGGYPSINLEVAHEFDVDPQADRDAVLDKLARQHFGDGAAPHVRRAWTQLSKAFEEFPFYMWVVYNAPHTYGPSNLLYREKTGYKATMLGFPYDDIYNWAHPYPNGTYARQMEKVAAGWAEGIKPLEEAAARTEGKQRAEVEDQLRMAKVARLHFATSGNQARFVIARELLAGAMLNASEAEELKAKMDMIAQSEIEIAKELYRLSKEDSRIGYEASNHYYYVPLDMAEKVINCEYVRRNTKFGRRTVPK